MLQCSIQPCFATFRMVWVPEKMGPKKFFKHFSRKYFMQKLTNTSVTKIFSRDTNMPPQRHQMSNIFGPSAPIMRGFHVLLNYLKEGGGGGGGEKEELFEKGG